MEKKYVLIVEDDEDIQQLVSYNLVKAGFSVEIVESGEAAIAAVEKCKPDLALLDIMLPDMDGLEVCKALRSEVRFSDLPIVMMTAKGEERDIVFGFESGVDDYITKPFSVSVLIARINAVLRRKERLPINKEDPADVIRRSELAINPHKHEVTINGVAAQLTPTEFNILSLLARKPGWVYTRQQIINSIRGDGYLLTPRAIDVQIFGLRKKLGEFGGRIETVRGIGYRLRED
ncbi:MAG: response regulator transcription factor [Desulfobulbaceae bacterium]|nr:response regulator transcription factor [Desulfobulbaceae bacterium]